MIGLPKTRLSPLQIISARSPDSPLQKVFSSHSCIIIGFHGDPTTPNDPPSPKSEESRSLNSRIDDYGMREEEGCRSRKERKCERCERNMDGRMRWGLIKCKFSHQGV